MLLEAHKCLPNACRVSGDIQGGYTWLLKHVNKKQIPQRKTKAIEKGGRLQKVTMVIPLLNTRSVPVPDCKEKLLRHEVLSLCIIASDKFLH